MVKELLGRPVADEIRSDLVSRIASLGNRGIVPKLAIVRVGEREDDLAYERGAVKRCEQLGITVKRHVLPDRCSQEMLLGLISQISNDPQLHGCLMFRPLPNQIDESSVFECLVPEKDVDGITSGSLYGVFAQRDHGFAPCTAEAVIRLLKYYDYDLRGKRVCVVGRSLVIGRPLAMLLLAHDATVTICHTRTADLASQCQCADIVIVAAGHMHTIGKDALRPGQVVIDVGINWDDDAARLVGDVDYDAAASIVSAITPVPGGVGAVTTAVLAAHVVEAAEKAGERS